MKKFILFFAVGIMTLSSIDSKAQAFDRGTNSITVAIGAADMFHIPVGYYSYRPSFYTPITGQLYVNGDFAVHKYVSVGFSAGIGGRAGGRFVAGPGPLGAGYYRGYYPEFNIAAGVTANFHFYQLIAAKSKRDIHADKLDIYAGLSLGSGIAIHPGGYYDNFGTYRGGAVNDVLFFFGPQVGVRYYFTPSIAVNGEVGFGRTLLSAGITFNLGGSKAGKK